MKEKHFVIYNGTVNFNGWLWHQYINQLRKSNKIIATWISYRRCGNE